MVKTAGAFNFINTSTPYGRFGFVHTSVMYFQGHRVATGKCKYLNRTWESYPFQSSMLRAAANALLNQKAMHAEIEKCINILRNESE